MYDQNFPNVLPAQGQIAAPSTPLRKKHVGFAILEAIMLLVSGIMWVVGSVGFIIYSNKDVVTLWYIFFYDANRETPIFYERRENINVPSTDEFTHTARITLVCMIVAALIFLLLILLKKKKALFGSTGLFLFSLFLEFIGFVLMLIIPNTSELIRAYNSSAWLSFVGRMMTEEELAVLEHQSIIMCLEMTAAISGLALVALIIAFVFSGKKKKEDINQWNAAQQSLKMYYDTQYQQCAAQLQALQANAAFSPEQSVLLPHEAPAFHGLPTWSRMSVRLFFLGWIVETIGLVIFLIYGLFSGSAPVFVGWCGVALVIVAFVVILLGIIVTIVQKVRESRCWAELENTYRSAVGFLMQQYMQQMLQFQVLPAVPAQTVALQQTPVPAALQKQTGFVTVPLSEQDMHPALPPDDEKSMEKNLNTRCSYCNIEIKPDAKFCPHCGAKQE